MTQDVEPENAGQERKPDENKRVRKFFGGLQSSFIAGVVVVAPIGITAGLIYWFVTGPMAQIDGFVKQAIPGWGHIDAYSKAIPGLGVVIAFAVIVLIGAATKNFVGRAAVRTGERLLESVPIVRTLYKFFRNVFNTALQKSDRAFQHVCLFEFPRPGVWALGFVINDTKGEVRYALKDQIEDPVTIFIPSLPIPTNGFVMYVPRTSVRILKMSVEDGAKVVISMGLVSPEFEDPDAAAKTLETMAEAAAKSKKPIFTLGR